MREPDYGQFLLTGRVDGRQNTPIAVFDSEVGARKYAEDVCKPGWRERKTTQNGNTSVVMYETRSESPPDTDIHEFRIYRIPHYSE